MSAELPMTNGLVEWVSVSQLPNSLVTGMIKWWGGWDSNPRPTDYESAALTG